MVEVFSGNLSGLIGDLSHTALLFLRRSPTTRQAWQSAWNHRCFSHHPVSSKEFQLVFQLQHLVLQVAFPLCPTTFLPVRVIWSEVEDELTRFSFRRFRKFLSFRVVVCFWEIDNFIRSMAFFLQFEANKIWGKRVCWQLLQVNWGKSSPTRSPTVVFFKLPNEYSML